MSEKVQSIALNSANVRYDNAIDVEKTFDLETNVNIQGNEAVSFDGGIVKKDSIIIASFSMYGNSNLSINFQNITDSTEMCSVLNEINAFIENIKADVESAEINL